MPDGRYVCHREIKMIDVSAPGIIPKIKFYLLLYYNHSHHIGNKETGHCVVLTHGMFSIQLSILKTPQTSFL